MEEFDVVLLANSLCQVYEYAQREWRFTLRASRLANQGNLSGPFVNLDSQSICSFIEPHVFRRLPIHPDFPWLLL